MIKTQNTDRNLIGNHRFISILFNPQTYSLKFSTKSGFFPVKQCWFGFFDNTKFNAVKTKIVLMYDLCIEY